ncbi:hypothetical protein [Streptomyces nojiriensis]|uniref:hypothetical protein n=1 Tax=Streptomyces nojiriensis TaxID=66374 RepID=UPI0036486FA8
MTLRAESSGGAPPARPAGPVPQRPADIGLEQRIARFTAGFSEHGGYRTPTDQERLAFVRAFAHLLDGDEEAARTGFAEIDFTLRTVTDATGGRRYAEVADGVSESGHTSRGWGRVYVDLDRPARWSVQVPHPVADSRTELLGARVLRGAPGGVLVLAGAHRDAGEGGTADVAHRDDSVFHGVVEELARRNLPGVQLHGFADESFRGRDAVVSTGAGDSAVADAERLTVALRSDGLEVCTAYSARCKLAGRENEQGRTAADRQSRFLHVELNKTLRGDDRGLDRAAAAITTLTDRWSRR